MTQTLSGQDIGRAHYATRAVLESLLADTGVPFAEWITVNMIATLGPETSEAAVVEGVANGLKLDRAQAQATLENVISAGLVARTGLKVSLTPAGTELHVLVSAQTATITERLYGDLPYDELAVAHRVLATVTERANALLSL